MVQKTHCYQDITSSQTEHIYLISIKLQEDVLIKINSKIHVTMQKPWNRQATFKEAYLKE
jgi:hypothetical protein